MASERKLVQAYQADWDPKGLHPSSGAGWQRRRSDYFAQFAFDRAERVSQLNGELVDEKTSLVPSKTEQHHIPSCDINLMLSKYEKTGILPRTASGEFFFGDFGDVKDFQSAQNAVRESYEAFMQLPAKVRAKFENDPGQLLAFVSDPANVKESVELGLVNFDLLPDDVKKSIRPPALPMGVPVPAATVPVAPSEPVSAPQAPASKK